jgi:hypothetical protein
LHECSRCSSCSSPLSSALRAGAVHQRAQQRQRDGLGGHAQSFAAACEQPRALLLEQLPATHLSAQNAREAHDRVDVARADRRALLEHDLEQAARRRELRVEMRQHVADERSVLLSVGVRDERRRAHVGVPPPELVVGLAGTAPMALTRGAVPPLGCVCAAPPAPAPAPSSWRVSWAASPRPPPCMTLAVSAWGSVEEICASLAAPEDSPSSEPDSPPCEPSPPSPLALVSDFESCSTSACSNASALS